MTTRAIAMTLLAMVHSAIADDKPAQKVEIGPATYQIPGSWVKQQPMQAGNLGPIAQYGIPLDAADDPKAKVQLRVYYFSGGGGGVDANIERWVNMFDSEGRKKTMDKLEVDGMKVHFVDIAGAYKDKPFPMAEDFTLRKDYRMLAAVVETPSDGPYFFRAVGPAKTMAKQVDGFKQMLKSAKKSG